MRWPYELQKERSCENKHIHTLSPTVRYAHWTPSFSYTYTYICGGGQGLSHSSGNNILKHIPCLVALEREIERERMMDRAFIKASVHMFRMLVRPWWRWFILFHISDYGKNEWAEKWKNEKKENQNKENEASESERWTDVNCEERERRGSKSVQCTHYSHNYSPGERI